ncbi:hypothetical protein BD779DRAFT_1673654 [Infundibulicybe gibba]|nr:hypothetical protein BD779DRAFT_1673654 [Infundibulicybe gibba]
MTYYQFILLCFLLFFPSPLSAHRINPRQVPSLAPLNKTALLPSLSSLNLSSVLSKAGVQNLTYLPNLPAACNSSSSICPDISSHNITLDDCSDPWTLCHCPSSNISLDTAVDRLSQIPVGLRRYIATITVMPGDSRAYTLLSGDINIFGDLPVEAWIHESAHAFDFALNVSHSGSPQWLAAVGNDSCVPDSYSATDLVEDFAQHALLKTYTLFNNLPPFPTSTKCMANQLAYVSSLALFNFSTFFGNTCAIGTNDGARHIAPPLPPSNVTHSQQVQGFAARSLRTLGGSVGFSICLVFVSWLINCDIYLW